MTGNPAVIPDELDVLRDEGRLVLLSSPHGETPFDFHDHCNFPSYEIIGAHVDSHPETATTANPWTRARNAALLFDLVATDRVAVEPLVTHRVPVTEAPDMYGSLLEDRSDALGVLFEW